MTKRMLLILLLFSEFLTPVLCEDGYRLWLRFNRIENESIRLAYSDNFKSIRIHGNSDILNTAKKELRSGLGSLLGYNVSIEHSPSASTTFDIGTIGESPAIDRLLSKSEKDNIESEGFFLTIKEEESKKAANA